MAGTVPTLTPGSITGISGLKDRPVFFLNLNGSTTANLVVKGDVAKPDSEISIKWGSKLMKNVQNRLVNVKIMAPAEVAVFQQAALAKFPQNTPERNFASAAAGTFRWVKMPHVGGLSDAEVFNGTDHADVEKIKELVTKLRDKEVWNELGKVLAVDIFIGNNDRFAVDSKNSTNEKPGDWINKGNLMFVDNGHGHSVIGLDFFDPFSQVANLKTGAAYDGLDILTDPNVRLTFCQNCVRSVGATLKGWLLKENRSGDLVIAVNGGYELRWIAIDTMETVFQGYFGYLGAGIEEGAQQLRDYLIHKFGAYKQQNAKATNAAIAAAASAATQQRKKARYAVQLSGPGALQPMQPPRPASPPPSKKSIPEGVLARMEYLGWL
ncbi:MAG: hypothetical protein WA324_24650 [Bryobacteraceae bacterium]